METVLIIVLGLIIAVILIVITAAITYADAEAGSETGEIAIVRDAAAFTAVAATDDCTDFVIHVTAVPSDATTDAAVIIAVAVTGSGTVKVK